MFSLLSSKKRSYLSRMPIFRSAWPGSSRSSISRPFSVLIAAIVTVAATSAESQIAPAPASGPNVATIPGATSPAQVPGLPGAANAVRSPFLQNAPSSTLPNPADPLPSATDPSNSPNGPADQSPTASGATLTNGAPTATNSQIGVARRFLYQFRIGSRFVFDDNILLSPDNKVSDEFFVLNGDVTLGLGDPTGAGNYLRFEYTPDASFYVANSGENAVQHSIVLAGLYQFSKLTVSGRFSIQLLDGTDLTTLTAAGAQSTQANLDVNGRTELNVYNGQLDLNYILSDKTSADLVAQYSISDYTTLISSESLSGSFFLNYIYSPKLTFGAGATAGVTLSQRPNPDEKFYQANLRANYEATGKISFNGTLGLEVRSSDDTSDLEVGPVFDLNAVYLPFDGTALSLSAGRRTTPSAVQGGQNYETTDLSISLRQRFFQRYFASLTTGYQNQNYVSEISGANATREDNYFYVQAAVDMTIHQNVSVGLAVLHRSSDSTAASAGFDDNQVSLNVSYSF